jgi:hypothetical protein
VKKKGILLSFAFAFAKNCNGELSVELSCESEVTTSMRKELQESNERKDLLFRLSDSEKEAKL